MENSPSELNVAKKPDIQLDIQKWLLKVLSFWWLFLIGLIIAIPSGYLYLRYATPLYQSKAKLLIKGTESAGSLSENALIEQLGFGTGGKSMENEIQILSSRPIISKTLQQLNANVTYFKVGAVKEVELYKSSPFTLDSYQLANGLESLTFYIDMDQQNEFRFMLQKGSEEAEVYQFDKPFSNEFGTFLISKNRAIKSAAGTYEVNILPLLNVANSYQGKLAVEIVGSAHLSNILELSLIDPSAQKAADIINTLVQVYNQAEIDDNTIILSNTIDFIDERIKSLTKELDTIEGDIERFKGENRIITEDASSSLGFVLDEMRTYLTELSALEIEKEILASLEGYLLDQRNSESLIPVSIATSNDALTNLIAEYNNLLLQQKRLKETATIENPIVQSNETRLQDLRNLMLATVRNQSSNLEIPVANAKRKVENLRSNMQNIPSVEKSLLEKVRLQSVKQELFLFLLQKREETALSKAITAVNTRIIESALTSRYPIFPNKKLILLACGLLGFLIPLLVIGVITLMETTIDSEDTLKSITGIPIIGRIARNKSKEKVLIKQGDRSVFAELFRLVRTNLDYLNVKNEKHVLLTTSSVSGEGKSVTVLNLGLTIALSEKKVVVVDLDLRKPRVAEYMGSQNKEGVTNYLTNRSSLENIINQYENNPYFNYVNSGPIPPNPSELILSDKMTELIEGLKERYDYVLIDTPPLGLVADALLLRKYITNTLLVVRQRYTKKAMLKYLDELHQNDELVRATIILNDVKTGAGGYKSYYGAGYYQE